MKAMRRRLALPTPKAFASPALPATAGRQCEIPRGRLFLFCEAFGVRTRPRVALTHCHYIVIIGARRNPNDKHDAPPSTCNERIVAHSPGFIATNLVRNSIN